MSKHLFIFIWLVITLPILYLIGVNVHHADENIGMCLLRSVFIGLLNGMAARSFYETFELDG